MTCNTKNGPVGPLYVNCTRAMGNFRDMIFSASESQNRHYFINTAWKNEIIAKRIIYLTES